MKKICDRVVQKLFEEMNKHDPDATPWRKQSLFVRDLYTNHAWDLRMIKRAKTKET